MNSEPNLYFDRNPVPDFSALLHLEPIREVLESDESYVIHCWALDSLERL